MRLSSKSTRSLCVRRIGRAYGKIGEEGHARSDTASPIRLWRRAARSRTGISRRRIFVLRGDDREPAGREPRRRRHPVPWRPCDCRCRDGCRVLWHRIFAADRAPGPELPIAWGAPLATATVARAPPAPRIPPAEPKPNRAAVVGGTPAPSPKPPKPVELVQQARSGPAAGPPRPYRVPVLIPPWRSRPEKPRRPPGLPRLPRRRAPRPTGQARRGRQQRQNRRRQPSPRPQTASPPSPGRRRACGCRRPSSTRC